MTENFNDKYVFYYRKDDKFQGMLMIPVDDYLTARNETFLKDIIQKLRDKNVFGKIEDENFIFTGLHIKQSRYMTILISD